MKMKTWLSAVTGLLLTGCASRLPEDELRLTRERISDYHLHNAMSQSEMTITSGIMLKLAQMERYLIEYRIWSQPVYDKIEKEFMADCEAWERKLKAEAAKPSGFEGGSMEPCDLNLRMEYFEQKRIDELKTKWRKP